jgi:ribose transport system substrate-binding protein
MKHLAGLTGRTGKGLLAAAALVVAGTGYAAAEDLDYFKGQITPYTTKPTFEAPGPAFDAAECAKGKSIFSIPDSSDNPFTANIEKAMAAAAEKVGLKFTTWQNQGTSAQYVQGMDTAVSQKVSLIDLLAGPDPRALVPQVKAAKAAGIPVIASHFNGYEQSGEVAKFADGDVPIDYFRAGSLLADWAVVNTEGKLNALVVTASGPLSSDSTLAGIKAELAKCPTCKFKILDYPGDWATKITPGVQAALLADPSVNYIITMYDPMTQFVVPAVTITGKTDTVKVDGFNGTPFAIGLVQQGKVDMDLGENLDWIGYAVIDAELRIICGLDPVKDPKIPLYIFDKSNAADAGTPPGLSKGYGDAYVEGYAKLWMLK